MKLEPRTASLIAVGASVSANCQPCLEINAGRALKYGAAPDEITYAIEVGRHVRAGAVSKLDGFATGSIVSAAARVPCECGSSSGSRGG